MEADIKACFDWIDHNWLLENIPVDRKILRQWLKCGFIQNRKLFPTRAGTPQGGIISPTMANMALDGLEKAVKAVNSRKRKINFVRYADDFIVTCDAKEDLTNVVIPIIKEFLAERGLTLSEEKTRITRIDDGFDFLGQNLRKFNNHLITRPSKDNINSFYNNVKNVIKSCRGSDANKLITKLNPVIRGWANYHKYVQSSDTFSKIEMYIYFLLVKWARRKHGNKTNKWIKNHYWGKSHDRFHFSCITQNSKGKSFVLELIKPKDVKLHRYIKIRGISNPYDPDQSEYFNMRRQLKNSIPLAKLA